MAPGPAATPRRYLNGATVYGGTYSATVFRRCRVQAYSSWQRREQTYSASSLHFPLLEANFPGNTLYIYIHMIFPPLSIKIMLE